MTYSSARSDSNDMVCSLVGAKPLRSGMCDLIGYRCGGSVLKRSDISINYHGITLPPSMNK